MLPCTKILHLNLFLTQGLGVWLCRYRKGRPINQTGYNLGYTPQN